MFKSSFAVKIINLFCILAVLAALMLSVNYLLAEKNPGLETPKESGTATSSYIIKEQTRMNDGIHTSERNQLSGDLEDVMKDIARKTEG